MPSARQRRRAAEAKVDARSVEAAQVLNEADHEARAQAAKQAELQDAVERRKREIELKKQADEPSIAHGMQVPQHSQPSRVGTPQGAQEAPGGGEV